MKFLLSIFLLIFSTQGMTGMKYYHEDIIDEYDRATGLYFNVIEKKVKEGGFISSGHLTYSVDINIFDPKTGKSRAVFKDNTLRRIERVWFESDYDADKKMILFNESSRYGMIKNNHNITERPPKNKLLIAVYNIKSKLNELWTANKQGDDLKKIKTFNSDYSWHIDIKNAKIRFVKQDENRLNIESLDW